MTPITRFLNFPGYEFQDFYPLCSPLASAILLCCDPNFQAGSQAFYGASVPLADRHIFPKNNARMGNLYAPQQVITALNVNPSVAKRVIQWRINDSSLEGPVNSPDRGAHEDKQEANDSNPAPHLISTMLSSCPVFVWAINQS